MQRSSWSLPCLLLQPFPREESWDFLPFTFHYYWDLATFPTFLQQAATSSRSFTLLNVAGLAHLQQGGYSAGLTASAPAVPYLSSVSSGRGASFPPAFVSAESRCWRRSKRPPAEIILIVCAAGSAPLCLTW